MYMPWDPQRKALVDLILNIIKSPEIKTEISNEIRMEIEASKSKYSKDNNSNTLSYDMLTRGNVNMQAKMAANGYDVYGKTIIPSNDAVGSNKNVYQKMKNKINYGSNPANGYENKGKMVKPEGSN